MVQILILAGVAAFLFWRLSIVLGIRTGFEKTVDLKIEDKPKNDQVDIENIKSDSADDEISDYVDLSSNSGQQLKKIKEKERPFQYKVLYRALRVLMK